MPKILTSVIAAYLLFPTYALAELSYEDTREFVQTSRLDLSVLRWGKSVREQIGLMSHGAPTRKAETILVNLVQLIDLQDLYTAVFYEFANGLDASDMEALEPCLESSGNSKYRAAVYHSTTEQGGREFRAAKIQIELGIGSMDPDRAQRIRESTLQNGDWAASGAVAASMASLFAQEARKIYPMLVPSEESITELAKKNASIPSSGESLRESTVVRYLLLEDLTALEFDDFMECEGLPEMNRYDALFLTGVSNYLESLIERD